MQEVKYCLIFIGLLSFSLSAQNYRYFRFKVDFGHGNWQDTSVIAAASDTSLINAVLAEMQKPMLHRKFITGPIEYGDGRHNYNASHIFNWHFVPDQWNLADFDIEACDGCPYTDLDGNTVYWVDTIGSFCPWSGIPVQEVVNTIGLRENKLQNVIKLYPVPSGDKLNIELTSKRTLELEVFNLLGQKIKRLHINSNQVMLDVSYWAAGVYLFRFSNLDEQYIRRIIISR